MNHQLMKQAVADNLRQLMAYKHLRNQVAAARFCGVSQRTISNLLNPTADISPTLAKLERVAAAFGVQPWQMLIPGLPLSQLTNHRFDRLVEHYLRASPAGRDNILRIAEAESRYARLGDGGT